MSLPFSLDRWLRLPSRIALLLGLGALSAAGAQADRGPESTDGTGVAPHASGAKLTLSNESGRLYLSEFGATTEELGLGDTPEARRLGMLVRRHGTEGGVELDRMLLAGGGGQGISWSPWEPVASERTPKATNSSSGEPASPPQHVKPPHRASSSSANSASPENRR